jgi:putative transposase
MIEKLHHDQPAMNIREACQTLGVSPAGYYAHRHKDQRPRSIQDAVLSPKITAAFDASRHTYGSPRIMHALRGEGARHGKNRIARLMRNLGLHVQQKRRYVPRTTIAGKTSPVSPNLLLERPEVTRLNEVWLTDITYIPTAEGFLYLAAELDLCSRRIIGWSTHSSLAAGLATEALERAFQARPAATLAGLLHHSDRGCQYTSAVFRKRLELSAITRSMSRKGNCYDNAAMESFWATLKAECFGSTIPATRAQAQLMIFDYIEPERSGDRRSQTFYNPLRLHSSLGFLSPVNFEQSIQPK